ncbi:MAG: helicase-associated domain-containing protein [Pirellulales bacterium]|nr:helicase-associated domain-containing protein [Pirellulales bacterium]
MNHFEIDWLDFLQRLPLWERLSLEARRAFAELETNQETPTARFHGQESILLEAGLIRCSQGRKRVSLERAGHRLARGIHAMLRRDIPADPSGDDLEGYLHDHFRHDELLALLSHDAFPSRAETARAVASIGWVQRFLARKAESPRPRFSQSHLPSWLSTATLPRESAEPSVALPAAQAIVRELMALPGPLPLAKLCERLPEVTLSVLADGLLLGIRDAVLFPTMRPADMVPLIGLWPAITRWLHRPKARPPQPVEARDNFHGPFLMEDMTTLLVAAAAAPLRLRVNDGGLYAKSLREMADSLMPLPDWFHQFAERSPEYRLEDASRWLQALALARRKRSYREHPRLEATPRGQRWLAQSPKDRLKFLLDYLRDGPDALRRLGEHDARDLHRFTHDATGLIEFLPVRIPTFGKSPGGGPDLRPAVTAAYAGLPEGEFAPLGDFLRWHVEQNNPLIGTDGGETRPRVHLDWSHRMTNQEDLEEFWQQCLASFLLHRLIPLGGVEFGIAGNENRWCIALTGPGRYLLGLAGDFDYGHDPAGQKLVVVQPNFDVVFLGPSPLAEAAIGRFAERRSRGHGALFAITKKSILAAAGSGLTAEQALETLRSASDKPIPANVEREITGWFDQCRRITIRTATLITCPDAETAARVVAAGGNQAVALTDTVVELADAQAKTALSRKLREVGVFLDEPAPGGRPPRTVGRRRTRR